jgi:hypothetical protein
LSHSKFSTFKNPYPLFKHSFPHHFKQQTTISHARNPQKINKNNAINSGHLPSHFKNKHISSFFARFEQNRQKMTISHYSLYFLFLFLITPSARSAPVQNATETVLQDDHQVGIPIGPVGDELSSEAGPIQPPAENRAHFGALPKSTGKGNSSN